MEYVEGEWLRGPVPLAQALELAEQIERRYIVTPVGYMHESSILIC